MLTDAGFPVLPNECDVCAKPLTLASTLRCAKCKARGFCSASCQKADWDAHRANCSPFPASLLPHSADNPGLIDKTCERLQVVIIYLAIQWSLVPGLLPAGMEATALRETAPPAQPLTDQQRWQAVTGAKNFPLVASFRVPPSLAPATYPGHKPDALHTFQHQLTLFIRLFLLKTITLLDVDDHPAFEVMFNPEVLAVSDKFVKLPVARAYKLGREAPGLRMVGEKVLAAPGSLSQGEYGVLHYFLATFCIHRGQRHPAQADEWHSLQASWHVLGVLLAVAKTCPRLMDLDCSAV